MKSFYLIKPYFSENRHLIIIGLLCLIAVDILQLFIPRIIKWAVDDLTTFQIDKTSLLFYALYITGIAVMTSIFRYGWRRCLIGTSMKIEEGLRNRLFDHIQTLSASYFDKVKTGDLMAHATNDIKHIRMATGMGIVAVTDAVFLGIVAIGFMIYINVKLTLFSLIPMPLIVFSTRFFSKRMHRMYDEVQGSFSDLTEGVRERFSGIRIIKAFNREKNETRRIEKISKNYIDKNLKLVRITGPFFPLMILFTNLSLAVVIYLGGRQTIISIITPGDFVAFISYLGLLTWPMMAIGWVTNLIQRGGASLDRISRILQVAPEIDDMPDAKSVQRVEGKIVFENVSFTYQPGSLPIISDIDIHLEAGKTLGIVGPQGSGKTTLLGLIPRLFDVHKGHILIDGMDIRKVKVRDLRSQISFMPQEPFLFSDTIRKNITLGNPLINDAELIKAAKQAALFDTIKSFPSGFDTRVGEKGVILSGGQKQRIALARALIHDVPILILDDPVSQVDMETGADIISTIRTMKGQKTIIIVSHRLSALRFADHIIVLQEGRVTESGTHEELMTLDKYYSKIFRLQSIEEELDAY